MHHFLRARKFKKQKHNHHVLKSHPLASAVPRYLRFWRSNCPHSEIIELLLSIVYDYDHIEQTCIRPSPPGLNQSDPQSSFYQQRTGEIFEYVIIEDGETTVVRGTSVDSCEPVDWLSVNLVTRRVVYNSVLTARLCSHNTRSYQSPQ